MSNSADTDRRGHDVDDRIGGADFMEMDLVDGDAVDLRFGFGEAGKDVERGVFNQRG